MSNYFDDLYESYTKSCSYQDFLEWDDPLLSKSGTVSLSKWRRYDGKTVNEFDDVVENALEWES